MKVFLHLASMLPHSIDKDASTVPIEKEILALVKVLLILFIFCLLCDHCLLVKKIKVFWMLLFLFQVGKSTDEYVENKRSKSKSPVQPYLIGVKAITSDSILKYFLVLDSTIIELGNVSFIRAVDWLFKSYHVFNLHYPLSWRNFFRFLQTCIYKIFVGTSDDVFPSAANLYSKLLSL